MQPHETCLRGCSVDRGPDCRLRNADPRRSGFHGDDAADLRDRRDGSRAGKRRRQTVYRTLFYFPSFTAGVATYILWKKLYSPENGPINNVLQPVLDRITPVAASISPTTAHVLSAVFLVVMGLVYSYALFRVIVSWKNGETRHVELYDRACRAFDPYAVLPALVQSAVGRRARIVARHSGSHFHCF